MAELEPEALVLRAGRAAAVVEAGASRLASLTVTGHDVLVPSGDEPPDAFNGGGGSVLEPGEALELALTIGWHRPD